jgi:hypothetical protein
MKGKNWNCVSHEIWALLRVEPWYILSTCIAGNQSWLYSSSPIRKIILYSKWAYCWCMKKEEISSSVPGLSEMTLRECRVDRPFPDLATRCWVRTAPPPSMVLGCLFKPSFFSLPSDTETLSHGLVISTPCSHSPTSTSTSSLPSATTPRSFE